MELISELTFRNNKSSLLIVLEIVNKISIVYIGVNEVDE